MISAMMQAMQATAMRHDAARLMFSANQNLMNLSANVRPDMTSRDILQLQRQEVRFAAQAAHAGWLYRMAALIEEQALRMMRAAEEAKRRLLAAGATFV